MSEFFNPRIEAITTNSPSFDHHAQRIARFMRQAEEIAKRVETQRQAAADTANAPAAPPSSPPAPAAPQPAAPPKT